MTATVGWSHIPLRRLVLTLLSCLVTSLLGLLYWLFVAFGRCADCVKDERVETEIEEVPYCGDLRLAASRTQVIHPR
jgi:hypothetical protein